nr:hypothetical protein [Tanacetum cinerariifolium]
MRRGFDNLFVLWDDGVANKNSGSVSLSHLVGIKRLLNAVEVTAAGYCSTAGLQSVEERLVHYKKNEAVFTEKINVLNLEVKLRDNALDIYTKNLEKVEKERDELKLTLEKYQNSSKPLNTLPESQVSDKVKSGLGYKAASSAEESFVKSSDMLDNQDNVKSRSDKGYHAVPLRYTGNYIPPKPNLMFIDEHVESEYVDVVSNVSSSAVKTVESKFKSVDVKNKGVYSTVETKTVKKNSFSPPIIEHWNSDDESEVEFELKVETGYGIEFAYVILSYGIVLKSDDPSLVLKQGDSESKTNLSRTSQNVLAELSSRW